MRRDTIERHAVPEDRLERFMGLVYSLVEPFGVDSIPDVYHYVELLGQAVERQVVESKFSTSPQHRLTADRRKFISIFKNRYLHLTDLEYNRGMTGVDAKLINQLSKTLADKGMEIDEYLAWLFDEFLADNPKFCPPTIKFSCSGFAVDKFLYENRDKIKQRSEEEVHKKASLDLIGRARVLIRFFFDDENVKKSIVETLKGYRDGSIILEKMRVDIEALEKVMRDSQAKEATGGLGNGIGS